MKKFLIFILVSCIICPHVTAQNKADSAFYKTKQSQWLTKKAGSWNVIMTIRPASNMDPAMINGLEAERTMIGAFCLHEIMHPAPGTSMPAFQRLSDLDYNRNDERWDYITIDTRITGGIMYFINYAYSNDTIVSYILNFPHPGLGPDQKDRGKNVRLRNVIISINSDHDIVYQYWKLTDGEEWLAVKYEYTRKK